MSLILEVSGLVGNFIARRILKNKVAERQTTTDVLRRNYRAGTYVSGPRLLYAIVIIIVFGR